MQIYTNFESNSQPHLSFSIASAIVSDANLHKFWKQFTTGTVTFKPGTQLFPMQIYTNFESNSQHLEFWRGDNIIVSDANLHKFWKQFTTYHGNIGI